MRLRVILLALLFLPSVSAGTERSPEVRDPRDLPEMTAADIVAAWVAGEERGLRVSIQTQDGSMPERYPDFVYWLYFRVRPSGEEVGVALGFANDGRLRGFLGNGPDGELNDDRVWRGGFERVANNELVSLEEERGQPSTWSGVVPWGAIEGLHEGATLDRFVAGSARYDRSSREWLGGIDRAESSATYVARVEGGVLRSMGGVFPILVPAWVIPTIVAVCTAGGLATGFAISRRAKARAADQTPAATPVPLRARPAPPGQRFQRAPPSKR